MSVKRSFSVTLASRIYLGLIALVMLPVYLQQLGLEAYGLMALFTVLQIWFQLLDMGLVPTMARETARHRAGALSAIDFRLLMRALEGLFLLIAGVAGASLYLCADLIATGWLKVDRLSPQVVLDCLQMMALCIAVRLLGELYRGVITGYERFDWMAGFNVAFGTLRMVMVVPFVTWMDGGVAHFFAFQLAAMAAELAVLVVMAYRLVPPAGQVTIPWRLAPLRKVLSFSVIMSLASIVWLTLSQIDKLILSGLLALDDYGAFSLAVAAAATVLLVSGSLADVLMPRMTHLRAQGSREALTGLYRDATQWAGISAWSIACLLALHAEHVLWIWTGDAALAAKAAPVLALYALGNAALAVGAMPYYLQYAEGRLRLHLLGTGLMAALLLPAVIWAAGRYGGVGAAAVWLGINVLYLLLWTPLAHARFLPGQHARWMFRDVLPVAALAGLAALACRALPFPPDRLGSAAVLLLAAIAVAAASASGSTWVHARLRQRGRARA